MPLRLKAFGLHLMASAGALAMILGGFWGVWYRGDAWYLSNVTAVILIMTGVDLVLGPLLTLVIATPTKTRSVLARDLTVIATVQLFALGYGALLLWKGRPLYYAYSNCCLTLVQAYDLDPVDTALAKQLRSPLAPYWYEPPRWVWAPLPEDSVQSGQIVASAVTGGYDVTAMPSHYQPFEAGSTALRKALKKIDESRFFFPQEKALLKKRMQAAGLPIDTANILPYTGRRRPLLAVFDPTTGALLKTFEPN